MSDDDVRQFGPIIRRVVRRQVHSWRRFKTVSDDIEQEVWLRLLATSTPIDQIDNPDAYITRITYHLIQDRHKDTVRQPSLESLSTADERSHCDHHASPPDVAASKRELMECVIQRCGDADPLLVHIIAERLGGATNAETASSLGLKEHDVRAKLSKAAKIYAREFED